MRKFIVNVNGTSYEVEVEEISGAPAAKAPAAVETVAKPAPAPAQKAPVAGGENVVSPMPGTILDVRVKVGDSVKSGDILMILEAMKMENEIMASADGKVASVAAAKGASVNTGDVLCTIA